MIKPLICLFCALIVAMVVLQMRQQRVDLSYQNNTIYRQIEQTKAKLWSQQMQIAVYTAPNAIAQTVGDQRLDLVPVFPIPVHKK